MGHIVYVTLFMSLFDSGQVIVHCQVNSCIPKMPMIDSDGNQFGGTLSFITLRFNFKILKKFFTGFQEGLLTLSFIEFGQYVGI